MASQVNGEVQPSSATLQHITGYPVVKDTLSAYKNNPYGKKSIELGDSAYQTFAKPVIPYLAKPYGYVSPYVKKADHFGAGALTKLDEKIPVLSTSTEELKQIAFFPVVKTKEGTDHVFSVYNSEFKKVGGDGVVTYGKAIISTGLVITSEALTWIGDFLRSSKEKAKEAGNDITQ
ncbi:hypothetical protein JX265_003123 [Neoarthrinium moseri]|uniref:Uncharacterized protein n=1 Tax=Neoarthrinium moseri TaxID=1658444 RepID=A0A9P9WTB4_9PEZI|nr:uncharacterized protein JN550_011265 [Neoarthrinium moseri]KAI1852636.1 hypothetical protein JX266_002177 [Neoarthrinium moseri]KAI1860803.1 hypothetical protein JN550_011265 [Neoarthrinium moseri]KAI1878946.1 hypothetical protein JX265_003123 [Neoarthrinium moseri]